MKLLLLQPRLDCSFKPGPVPDLEGPPNHPLRRYWELFFASIVGYCKTHNHELIVLKKPLWQFSPHDIDEYDCDYALVPHKNQQNFPHHKALYYMQQALPWLFSIDPNGWQSDTEFYPLQPSDNNSTIIFDQLKSNWSDKNESKFEQPNVNVKLPTNFIFFPCQIPHDESIKYHSNISSVDALKMTCEFAIEKEINVVIKPHPVNIASMQSQFDVCNEYLDSGLIHWIDICSIHQCLQQCDSVFLVNSGVGLEALLYNKPVFAYGKADYESVVWSAIQASECWEKRFNFIDKYPAFINAYYMNHYDVHDSHSFEKLEKYNGNRK